MKYYILIYKKSYQFEIMIFSYVNFINSLDNKKSTLPFISISVGGAIYKNGIIQIVVSIIKANFVICFRATN